MADEQGLPVVVIPPDWTGKCVVCGGVMTAEDFRQQRGILVVEANVCCHARHVENEDEYEATVKAMALATVEALKCRQANNN